MPLVAHPDTAVEADERLADGDTIASGALEIQALYTPGHCADHVAFLVDGTGCLTADCLFRGTVGGTAGGGPTATGSRCTRSWTCCWPCRPRLASIRAIGSRPRSRTSSRPTPSSASGAGLDPEGSDPCRVRGEEATLVLWGPDYDGTHKAWVRFADGRDAIVGGSQVERD